MRDDEQWTAAQIDHEQVAGLANRQAILTACPVLIGKPADARSIAFDIG